MYRYVYPSVYQSVWPHLRFKKGMSRIHHNYSRRIDSRPHGFDARKFNRGSQGKRHRYTYEEMATALHKREMFIADGFTRVRGSLSYTDRNVHLKSGTTSRWLRNADHIFSMAADEWCKKLKVSVTMAKREAGHYRHFPKADEALYQLFCKRRRAGRPVSIRWLLLKYKFYVNKYYPDKPCKANATVVKRWRKKYKIVQRRKTNKTSGSHARTASRRVGCTTGRTSRRGAPASQSTPSTAVSSRSTPSVLTKALSRSPCRAASPTNTAV